MNEEVIYPTEQSVIDDMIKNNLNKVIMFFTAYVDENDNYQKFGFTVKNIDKGYYVRQNTLSKATKTFSIN